MPYIRVEMLEGRSDEQKAKLAQAITNAMVEHAGAKPDSIFVVIEDVKKSNWATGGTLMSQRK
ncbi:4-oxalocrotonate tautomerase [Bordetella sp. FB-8]|uniref:4-oxalocrotonate tautomerase n=1 Tax=Bordetella sp. FB-8 TaxID=1159870 RepID=UPI0003736D0E|nr:4-oxalocrotonate tautomerase [Bordetella sp. FB-8]